MTNFLMAWGCAKGDRGDLYIPTPEEYAEAMQGFSDWVMEIEQEPDFEALEVAYAIA